LEEGVRGGTRNVTKRGSRSVLNREKKGGKKKTVVGLTGEQEVAGGYRFSGRRTSRASKRAEEESRLSRIGHESKELRLSIPCQ